ncbi:hypothetical protein TTHERM_000144909 (macronuclear) [Tetrahymena thermophila SB210]|uniref:Uncharacterized protein n=1 Tax=Tetrahymena thermophila (strain SB210) TaxID=312017 RepID=W7XFN1_TETTS|nr:hypothetical protein TTHERM_000144909 [Tetrahymena thermophila SB210]EWS75653.1 hypothetical protein TTHERM_000144909 [Tetrahymena thermophila SB210]|eukprot:XP_012651799.1 hypothetical protein TTHERM_000144909 [Tetrahymena thermophila SB210]
MKNQLKQIIKLQLTNQSGSQEYLKKNILMTYLSFTINLLQFLQIATQLRKQKIKQITKQVSLVQFTKFIHFFSQIQFNKLINIINQPIHPLSLLQQNSKLFQQLNCIKT